MQTRLAKSKKNWLRYLQLSVLVTAAATAFCCLVLKDYNIFFTNQLSIQSKAMLAVAGATASIVSGFLNARSIGALWGTISLRYKFPRLLLLNLPVLIFQLFVLAAVVIIICYD